MQPSRSRWQPSEWSGRPCEDSRIQLVFETHGQDTAAVVDDADKLGKSLQNWCDIRRGQHTSMTLSQEPTAELMSSFLDWTCNDEVVLRGSLSCRRSRRLCTVQPSSCTSLGFFHEGRSQDTYDGCCRLSGTDLEIFKPAPLVTFLQVVQRLEWHGIARQSCLPRALGLLACDAGATGTRTRMKRETGPRLRNTAP